MPVFTAAASAILTATTSLAAGSTGFLIAQSVVAAGLAAGTARALGLFDAPNIDAPDIQFDDPGSEQRLGASTRNKLPCLYGNWQQRGALVYFETTTDRQTLYAVIALGEANTGTAINTVYWDDIRLTLNTSGEVTGGTDVEGNATDRLNGNVNVQLYPTGGRSTYLENLSSNWTSSHRMTGITYAVVTVRYNRNSDVTGLADMRFIGTATIDSPGDAVLDQLQNTTYGLGLPDSAIDMDSFNTANSYFNAMVAHTNASGSTVLAPRFQVNGGMGTDLSIRERIENILIGSNSSLRWSDGRYGLFVNRAETPVAYTFNTDNVIGDINVTELGLTTTINRMEIQYGRDPSNNYQRNTAIIELPNNSRFPNELDRTQTLDLPLVATAVEAERVGTIILNQSREQLVIRHRADVTAHPLEAGDVVNYTMENYGWTDKQFRILKISEIEEEGRIEYEVEALEYTAAVYADRTFVEPDASPNTNLPSADDIVAVTDLAVANVQLTANIPSFDLTWTVPNNSLIEAFDVFYNPSVPTFGASTTRFLKTILPTGGNDAFTNGSSIADEITTLPSGDHSLWVVGRNAFARSSESNTASVTWNPQIVASDATTVYRFHENAVTNDPGAPTGADGTGGGWYDADSPSAPSDPNPHWEAVGQGTITNQSNRELDFTFTGNSADVTTSNVPTNQDLLFNLSGLPGETTTTSDGSPERAELTITGNTGSDTSGTPSFTDIMITGNTGVSSGGTFPNNSSWGSMGDRFTFSIGLASGLTTTLRIRTNNTGSASELTSSNSTAFTLRTTIGGVVTTGSIGILDIISAIETSPNNYTYTVEINSGTNNFYYRTSSDRNAQREVGGFTGSTPVTLTNLVLGNAAQDASQITVSGVTLTFPLDLSSQSAIQSNFISQFNGNNTLQAVYLPAVTQGNGVRITTRNNGNISIPISVNDRDGDITLTQAFTAGTAGTTANASQVRIVGSGGITVDETITLSSGLTTQATIASSFKSAFDANTNLQAVFIEANIRADNVVEIETRSNGNFVITATAIDRDGDITITQTNVDGSSDTGGNPEVITLTVTGDTGSMGSSTSYGSSSQLYTNTTTTNSALRPNTDNASIFRTDTNPIPSASNDSHQFSINPNSTDSGILTSGLFSLGTVFDNAGTGGRDVRGLLELVITPSGGTATTLPVAFIGTETGNDIFRLFILSSEMPQNILSNNLQFNWELRSPASNASQIRFQVGSVDETITLTAGLTTQAAIANDVRDMFNANTNLRTIFNAATVNASNEVILTSTANANISATITAIDNGGNITITEEVVDGSNVTIIGQATTIRAVVGTTEVLNQSFNGSTLAQIITALQNAYNTHRTANPTAGYNVSTTSSTIRLQSTFTGQTPLANITITQQGRDTSNQPATLLISRTITNDGINRNVMSGQLSTVSATVGGTSIGTVTITDNSSATSVVTQVINGLSTPSYALTDSGNGVIRATSTFFGSTPDLLITVSPGLDSDNSTPTLAVARAVTTAGNAGGVDLTSAQWTYFPTNREIRTDTDTIGIMNNGQLTVPVGLVVDSESIAADTTQSGNTLARVESSERHLTKNHISDIIVFGAVAGLLESTSSGTDVVSFALEASVDNGTTWQRQSPIPVGYNINRGSGFGGQLFNCASYIAITVQDVPANTSVRFRVVVIGPTTHFNGGWGWAASIIEERNNPI